MTDFGAFIELEPGVDALLHVSQISREHVEKPSDVLTVGQEIAAKIVSFNADDKKISLSMKAMETDAAPATTSLADEMPAEFAEEAEEAVEEAPAVEEAVVEEEAPAVEEAAEAAEEAAEEAPAEE